MEAEGEPLGSVFAALPAVILAGVINAIGGGLLRDILTLATHYNWQTGAIKTEKEIAK